MAPHPPLPPVPNKDLLLRLSYTQQAAAFLQLAQLGQTSSSTTSTPVPRSTKGKERASAEEASSRKAKGKRRRTKRDGQGGSLARLARSLASDIPRIASHNKLRLDPNLKRSLCRTCHSVLLPGLTAKVNIRPSKTHLHSVTTTCSTCATRKTLPRPNLHPPLTPEGGAAIPNSKLLPSNGLGAPGAGATLLSETPSQAAADFTAAAPPKHPTSVPSTASSAPAPPTLRLNRAERRQQHLLSRRLNLTASQLAPSPPPPSKFKGGQRRPGGSPPGSGTGGGREVLSEREGVGHWRSEGAGWAEV